jgi:hypothetical protein
MGQYFKAIMKTLNGKNVVFKNPKNYLKLMEHSWYKNTFVNSIAELLYHSPAQISWVGDYADKNTESYRIAYNKKAQTIIPDPSTFNLDNKFLVNHSKKTYIDINKYKMLSKDPDGEIVHPLPLLTAEGNGEGGGDYYSESHFNDVGLWAMDLVSVEDEIPKGYSEFEVFFIENYYKIG